jgi:Fic family protein
MIAFGDAIDAEVLRIRHEFLEMPGLHLTIADVARRYSVSTSHAQRMLDTLAAEGFLVQGDDGHYTRAGVAPLLPVNDHRFIPTTKN